MKFRNSQDTINDVKMLADANGKIIHIGNEAKLNVAVKIGDSASKVLGINSFNKMMMLNGTIDIVEAANENYNIAVIKATTGVAKTFEIHLFKELDYSTENFIKDKIMFSSYASVVKSKNGKTINIDEFLNSLVSTVKDDLRFAYKKFAISESNVQGSELYVNYTHLCTMAIGAISVLNDIDYKSPIMLSVDESCGKFTFNLYIETEYSSKSAKGISAFSNAFPSTTMPLTYLENLCDEDRVGCEFSIEPRKINISFDISFMLDKDTKLEYNQLGDDYCTCIKDAMKIFFIDTSEEEQQ